MSGAWLYAYGLLVTGLLVLWPVALWQRLVTELLATLPGGRSCSHLFASIRNGREQERSDQMALVIRLLSADAAVCSFGKILVFNSCELILVA